MGVSQLSPERPSGVTSGSAIEGSIPWLRVFVEGVVIVGDGGELGASPNHDSNPMP